MYARVTQLEIDSLRISIDEAVALFEQETLPKLRAQSGYRGVFVLTTPDGKAALMSLWDTKQAAQTETQFYTTELAKYLTLFRAAPGREAYEVAVCDGCALTSV